MDYQTAVIVLLIAFVLYLMWKRNQSNLTAPEASQYFPPGTTKEQAQQIFDNISKQIMDNAKAQYAQMAAQGQNAQIPTVAGQVQADLETLNTAYHEYVSK